MMNRRRALAAFGSLAALPVSGCGAGGSSTPDLVWGIHGTRDGWLHKPRVAAFDSQDQLYIADLTDRIQVFDRDGKFLRAWRTPSLNIDGPNGLTVDRFNRVLVADTHFYRVLVYDRYGSLMFQVGDGIQGEEPGRFTYPTDAVIDSRGNFLVSDYGNTDRILVFSPEGKFLREWGGHGYEPGEFLRPRAIAIDAKDRLYVADSCNHRIQIFDTNGKVLQIIGGTRGVKMGEMAFPYDVALGRDGSIFAVEYGNSRVQKFSADGRSLGVWGGHGRDPGRMNNPWALAVDSRGAVSVIDSNNHRVQRFRL